MTTTTAPPAAGPRAAGPLWTAGELNRIADDPATPKPVRELITRHTTLFFAWRDAQNTAAEANKKVEAARERDDTARAAALATGAQPPADTLPKAATAAAKAERARDDLARAVQLVEDHIRAAVAQHTPEWLAELGRREKAASQAIAHAVGEVERALATKYTLAQIRRTVIDPYGRKSWPAAHHLEAPYAPLVDQLRSYI